MLKEVFRTLLPAKDKDKIESLIAEPAKEMRRNVSPACIECQKKKAKVKSRPFPRLEERANIITMHKMCNQGPLVSIGSNRDRRRKAYITRLLNSHAALCRLATKLRSVTPEDILWLVWQIQSWPNDQVIVNYFVHMLD